MSRQYDDKHILGFYTENDESSHSNSKESQNSNEKGNIIRLSVSKIFGNKSINNEKNQTKNLNKIKRMKMFNKTYRRKNSQQNDFEQVDQKQDQHQKFQSFSDDKDYCQKLQGKCHSRTNLPKYVYPGETKNMYYNICQNLKHFICKYFQSQKSYQSYDEIKKFVESPQRLGYFEFKRMLKESSKLQQITRMFFAQLGWARFFILNNRVDLEQYFRYKPNFLIDK
ncbi:unnamed protein product (macronuclear) [Paramecium tetraurelia]|uniref:HTH OST-type domain-containing protein n=1 Tax=Paramecium tetraurelia TaxID=5888 RepID=A0D9H4_PARTE|nr:uncharacterized protein GSPATT00014621001 [Paramecium tetraurelia]CAK79691.1 unnamed protein product [Paramecium tetraurelia]|eukprot:XP_001447088.1 hypothetical protein (macronuclear) [Paramecium tetraurelia strain d4-2]